jgi:hypothetical protein
MTTVTITLTDTEEGVVESTMDVIGQDTSKPVEMTTAVIFGETIMRAIPEDGFWQLARALVPEVFSEDTE